MSNATETTLLDSVPDGLFIGGEWSPAISGTTLDVYDPATGEVIKTIANAARRGWCRRAGRSCQCCGGLG